MEWHKGKYLGFSWWRAWPYPGKARILRRLHKSQISLYKLRVLGPYRHLQSFASGDICGRVIGGTEVGLCIPVSHQQRGKQTLAVSVLGGL